ncbi:MAG TPA: hypothetical protein VK586_01280 [Streptosporangiaceae bacterium]|nr:hypothetical protein [Streptosporangiaceae bacterium]
MSAGTPAVPEQPEAATGPTPPPAARGGAPLVFDMPGGGAPGAAAGTPGKVTLRAVAPVGSVTIPPLEPGGESVLITREGTQVDVDTARRAHEAAARSGFTLRED